MAAFANGGSYPRCEKNSDLLTMRVSPEAEHGYVVAEKLREGGGSVALACEPAPPPHPAFNPPCL